VKSRVLHNRSTFVFHVHTPLIHDFHGISSSRDLKRTVHLDSLPTSFYLQPRNGIPITPWYDDPHDDSLLSLLELLPDVNQTSDVRPYLHETFKVKALIKQLLEHRDNEDELFE
jgi:TFIIF-interacting CTD phosphatase-like protein